MGSLEHKQYYYDNGNMESHDMMEAFKTTDMDGEDNFDINDSIKKALRDRTMEQEFLFDAPPPRVSKAKSQLLKIYTEGAYNVDPDTMEIGWDNTDYTPPLDLRAVNNAFNQRVGYYTADMPDSADAGFTEFEMDKEEMSQVRFKEINTIKKLIKHNQANQVSSLNIATKHDTNQDHFQFDIDNHHLNTTTPKDLQKVNGAAISFVETIPSVNDFDNSAADFKSAFVNTINPYNNEDNRGGQVVSNVEHSIDVHKLVNAKTLHNKIKQVKDIRSMTDVEHEFIPGVSTIFSAQKVGNSDIGRQANLDLEQSSFANSRTQELLNHISKRDNSRQTIDGRSVSDMKSALNIKSITNIKKYSNGKEHSKLKTIMTPDDFKQKVLNPTISSAIKKGVLPDFNSRDLNAYETNIDVMKSFNTINKQVVQDTVKRAKAGDVAHEMKQSIVGLIKQGPKSDYNSTRNNFTNDTEYKNSITSHSNATGNNSTHQRIKQVDIIKPILEGSTVKNYKLSKQDQKVANVKDIMLTHEMKKQRYNRIVRGLQEKVGVEINSYDSYIEREDNKVNLSSREAFISNDGKDSNKMSSYETEENKLYFEDI